MALETVTYRRRMNRSLEVRGIHVGMAGNAESLRGSGDELDARDVFVGPNLMTTGAADRDGGVNEFALGLIFVTLGALG